MRPLRASLSIRTSPTADSSSVCDTLGLHLGVLDDSRHCDDLVAAHDEWPRLALGAGDLGIDEHVLDLLAPAGEPVARPPASYLKACELGFDLPGAPANRSLERDRPPLEPGAVVLADELDAVAEIQPLGAHRRRDQLREGGLQRRAALQRTQQVLVGGWVDLPQERQDALANQSARRVAVAAVGAVVEPICPAVRLGLVTPERQQWAHDAVLTLRLDPRRPAARYEPVEDGLHLVGSRVPGSTEPVGRKAVTDLA